MKKTTKAKRSAALKPSSTTSAERRVSELDWKDLAAGLGGATRGAGGVPESDLLAYFGEEELAHLRQLAGFTQTVRSRSAALGDVIFLHGITGSDLGVAAGSGKPDSVWVNFFRLIEGRID